LVTLAVAISLVGVYIFTGPAPYFIQPQIDELIERNGTALRIRELLDEYCHKKTTNADCSNSSEEATLHFLGRRFPEGLSANAKDLVLSLRRPTENFSDLWTFKGYSESWTNLLADLKTLAHQNYYLIGNNWTFLGAMKALWLHGPISHIINNLLFLLIFGIYVERRIGSVNFAAAYLFSGVISTLIFGLSFQHELGVYVGSSTAIDGIMGLFVVLLNYFKFKNPIQTTRNLIFVLLGNLLVIAMVYSDMIAEFFENLTTPPTATAHLLGFLIGLLWGVVCIYSSFSERAHSSISLLEERA
jgi:membrane associated rhomboid family serine protease